MTIEMMREFLAWCSVINVGMLIFSFIIMCAARKTIYHFHSKLFPMSEQQFNGIMYAFLGGYKILIIVFNIVPYLALSMMMK